MKVRAAARMLVYRSHPASEEARLAHRPAPRLPLGSPRKENPRFGPELATQLPQTNSGIDRHPCANRQRAPLDARRQWPNKRHHPADKKRIGLAKSPGGNMIAPHQPAAATYAHGAAAPARVRPPNHRAVDGAIDKNPKLSKLVHWPPLDVMRQ